MKINDIQTNNNKMTNFNIKTKIGILNAIVDDEFLYQLLFAKPNEVNDCIDNVKSIIDFSENKVIAKLMQEMKGYFDGKLRKFTIPIKQNGSQFQQSVWNSLENIAFGETISYKQQAKIIGRIKSFRAVANANAKNKIMIIVPCHRVIKSDSSLGGYIGGEDKKEYLINHEKFYRF